MKKLMLLWALLIPCIGHASTLEWDTPLGTFGLPFEATEALVGYDGINKQAIAGASLPVYTDPKGIFVLQIGGVGAWQSNQHAQPYFALGHDIMREITDNPKFNSLHLNAFGDYAGNGRAGAGVAVSYAFAGGSFAQ